MAKFNGIQYPRAYLDRFWKLELLNQFHDVLPGSSIGLVYIDAVRIYKDVVSSANALLESQRSSTMTAFNSLNWPREMHVVESQSMKDAHSFQKSSDGKDLILLPTLPSFSVASIVPIHAKLPFSVSAKEDFLETESEEYTLGNKGM